jgi:hypothetical protein
VLSRLEALHYSLSLANGKVRILSTLFSPLCADETVTTLDDNYTGLRTSAGATPFSTRSAARIRRSSLPLSRCGRTRLTWNLLVRCFAEHWSSVANDNRARAGTR